jgi:hypothetical protein
VHAAARKGYRDRGLTLTRRVLSPETALGSAAFLLPHGSPCMPRLGKAIAKTSNRLFLPVMPPEQAALEPSSPLPKIGQYERRVSPPRPRQDAGEAVGAKVQRYEKRVDAKSPLLHSNGSIGDWVSRLRICCKILGEARPTISQAEAIDNLFAGLAEVIREQAWPENIFFKVSNCAQKSSHLGSTFSP